MIYDHAAEPEVVEAASIRSYPIPGAEGVEVADAFASITWFPHGMYFRVSAVDAGAHHALVRHTGSPNCARWLWESALGLSLSEWGRLRLGELEEGMVGA